LSSRGSFRHNAKIFADQGMVHSRQLQGRDDAQLIDASTNTLTALVGQVHHAVRLRPLLCRMVGELCYVIQMFCK